MTQTQANDDGAGSTNTTRRGFVRIGIGATAAAAGIGAGSGPAAAQSCDPEQSISCSYGGQPDFGVSYLVGRVKEHFNKTGDSTNYESKQQDQLYIQLLQDHEIIKSENDRTLTQASNLLSYAKSAAYQIARKKLLKELNAGTDFADAKIAAEEAVTGYFVPTQKNVLERWSVMAEQYKLTVDRAKSVGSVSDYIQIKSSFDSAKGGTISFPTTSMTLLDDSTFEVTQIEADPNDFSASWQYDPTTHPEGNSAQEQSKLYIPANPEQGYDNDTTIYNGGTDEDWERWNSVYTDIITKHDEAIDEIRNFADGIQSSYIAGDIDTEDLVSPRDLWEMGSDDAETPYAAADLAGLGLQINQDSSVVIKLLDDDNQLEGSVYLSKSPIGESLTVGNVYDPTASRATDADGNPNDTISDYEATASDPIPLDGLTFIAYNTDDGSTYDQIEQPFEVINAFNEEGEELQNVGYEPSKGQQTTTTDIDELRKELQSMNEEIIRLEEERRELATGGAGGFFGGSDGGVIAAAAAAGALLFVVLGGGGGS